MGERNSNFAGGMRIDAAVMRMAGVARSAWRGVSLPGRLARRLLEMAGDPPVKLVLWNGETVGAVDDPVATVRITSIPALARLLWNPDLHFGDALQFGPPARIRGDLL